MSSSNPKPWAKLYGTNRWARRSKLNLRMNPLCAECKRKGITKEANLSHHVNEWLPSFSTYEFFYGDLESLCFDCHADHHGFNKASRDFEADIGPDGYPLDTLNHPFWKVSLAQEARDKDD
jgi:hypothetical protein